MWSGRRWGSAGARPSSAFSASGWTPERPPDSQRIRIMAPVHQYEQEYVLAGRIERIEADMDKVTMTIASERMIPTGIYYG